MIDEESKQRFHRFTQKGPDCWVWQSTISSCGHGKMWVGRYSNRKNMLAKDVSWIIYNGPVPDNHSVHITCSNPSCVNPAHLKLREGARKIYSEAERYARRRQQKREAYARKKNTIDAWKLLLCTPWRKDVKPNRQPASTREAL